LALTFRPRFSYCGVAWKFAIAGKEKPVAADNSGPFSIRADLQSNLEGYIEAFDDVNNNFQIDSNEPIGYWDQNNNGRWDDMLILQPGQTITGADITLTSQSGNPIRRPAGIIK